MNQELEYYNDILIVGNNNIGKRLSRELKDAGKISIQDVTSDSPELHFSYTKEFKCAFICTKVSIDLDGNISTKDIESSVENTRAKVIVIKSTVPVGTCERLAERFKKNIVYSPESYQCETKEIEKTNVLILAGDKEYTDMVAELYQKVHGSELRIYFTDYKTAELSKYMENCFFAMKETFCAEFYDVADQLGVSYPRLRELFVLNENVGDSNTFVNPKETYYNTSNLNSDIPAFISQTDRAHLMTKVQEINKAKKIGDIRYKIF